MGQYTNFISQRLTVRSRFTLTIVKRHLPVVIKKPDQPDQGEDKEQVKKNVVPFYASMDNSKLKINSGKRQEHQPENAYEE
jgi:hypothetical protein